MLIFFKNIGSKLPFNSEKSKSNYYVCFENYDNLSMFFVVVVFL